MNLFNLTPDELKKMNKNEVHEAYKKMFARILMTFYLDIIKVSDDLETIRDLSNYIGHWIAAYIVPARSDWNVEDGSEIN